MVDFKLQIATVTENITVVASTRSSTSRAPARQRTSRKMRSRTFPQSSAIFDFARMSPYYNFNPDSANGDGQMSVAGRNNRYNNMQIDGAVNNDVFGVSGTGTPGGQTGTQPISLDAIQGVQLVVAPYDVRQGGFSGGGVNAVTRSGSNAFSGTAYFFGRNQTSSAGFRRLRPPRTRRRRTPSSASFPIARVANVGGPIRRNTAFFFTNLYWARKTVPVGLSVSGNSGQPWNHQAEMQQIASIAKAQYGYDGGNFDEVSPPTTSDKFFLRCDFNLSSHNQLTARFSGGACAAVRGRAFQHGRSTAGREILCPRVRRVRRRPVAGSSQSAPTLCRLPRCGPRASASTGTSATVT